MKMIKGIAGAPGIVCSKVLFFEKKSAETQNIGIDEAIEKALEKVRMLHKKALAELGEDKAKIFSAYEMLLEDSMLTAPIKNAIEEGSDAETAVRSVTQSTADILSSKKNEYMRQRADDILYIGELLIGEMHGSDSDFSFPEGDEKYILAAKELTPVDTMLFDINQLAGLITEKGGAASHTVILAKSLGIPAVVGAVDIFRAKDGENAYLDGYSGILIASPDEKTQAEYNQKLKEEKRLNESLENIKNSAAHTKDGERIAVCINIGKPSDMKGYEEERLDGVGLFRSEFLYSSEKTKPSQKEQENAYREVIKKAAPGCVTIRTLDAGGDKQIEYLNMKAEENPFLGSRGIRLCLSNPDIFREQLYAILLAGAGEKVKVMLPMVTGLDEIKAAKSIIGSIQSELEEKGCGYCKELSVGIMIETPASAIMADTFAKHCDFFSIGTNDLVQYITAADRGNADVEKLYNPYHPAVMKMINHVIKAGAAAGIEVSVCGDLAANTCFTEVLLGMGLKKFSVPLPMASRIKYKIGSIDIKDAERLAEKVLAAEDEHETENLIRKGHTK